MHLESRPRVLLVDDEQKLTDLLRLELEVEGYDVDVASDGASGLIRSRSEPTPDLIILDWNLPDFSGIDICQRIRTGGINIPILMLTGHDEITDRVKALDAGVDDYLIKPFSIDELMARLRAMHRRAEAFQGTAAIAQSAPDPLRMTTMNLSYSCRIAHLSSIPSTVAVLPRTTSCHHCASPPR